MRYLISAPLWVYDPIPNSDRRLERIFGQLLADHVSSTNHKSVLAPPHQAFSQTSETSTKGALCPNKEFL